jgi:dTDP-4-dehydrorhamnose reductase
MSAILVIGKTGQVGRELVRCLQPLGDVVATGRAELDLCDCDAIRQVVRRVAPEIIVNAAAYTAVDKAESEPDLALQVNGIAPGVLAEEAKRAGALFVHYSTDYIFDGLLGRPYVEDDTPNPLNAYGRTKLHGERAIAAVGGAYLILRTSWIYSAQPPNFVLAMLKLGRERKGIAVVDDQVGSPTWARTLASSTAKVLRNAPLARSHAGVFHLSAHDWTTRYQFARRIFELAREIAPGSSGSPQLSPIATAKFPLPAARPLNAATRKEKIEGVFGVRMPGWERQLRECLVSLLPIESRHPVVERTPDI